MVRIVAYLPGPSGDPGTERCHALPAKMKERMARHHFHILDGKADLDHHGTELADLEAAKEEEALKLAGEVLRESKPGDIWAIKSWKLLVNGYPSPEAGRTYFTLALSAADDVSA